MVLCIARELDLRCSCDTQVLTLYPRSAGVQGLDSEVNGDLASRSSPILGVNNCTKANATKALRLLPGEMKAGCTAWKRLTCMQMKA